MSINYEIYGTPETWHNCYYGGGSTASWATMLHGEKAKVPTWDSAHPSDPPTFENSQLRYAVDDKKLSPKEPIDNSICAVGQGKASPFRQFTIFRNDATTEHSSGEIRQVGQAYTGASYNDNNIINTFWFEANSFTSSGNYGNGAFSRGRLQIRDGATVAQGIDQRIWSPSGVNEHGTNKQNGNFYIAPFLSYGSRTYVLQILVWVTNADYTADFTPGTGTPAGQWRTLDDWKNNYPTKAITACLLTPRVISTYNSSTGAIGYFRVNFESSQYRKVGSGILDTIKFEFDDGTTLPELTDYGLFSANSNANVGVALFNEMTLYKWSDTLQNIGIVNSYIASYIRSNGQFMTPYIPYSTDIYDWIMSACACFGMAFTPAKAIGADASNCVFNQAFTDPDLCLPIIDANGIANGEYTRGTDNLDNDFIDLKSQWDKNYDPVKPPVPIPSTDPILPEGLQFTLAGRGTGVWALTPSEIDQVWADVFGSGVKPTMFGNNPMNAILSLKWTPFIWNPTGTDPYSPIVLGDTAVNELHEYPVINTVSTSERHAYGSIKFQFDKNFFNARYIQARLFLPFYGYYELPAAQLLSSTLRVDFYYNVPDELGVYIICYDDVIYDYVECCCDMEVPLTGSNAAAISASKRSEALSIATQVGAAAATAIMGASAIKALGTGLSNIAAAGYEGAWGYGGGIKGFIGAAKDSTRIMAEEGFINPRGMAKGGAALGGLGAVGGGIGNTIYKASVERAALKTNLPYHGSALQTTFLHMSMVPYVQIFRNAIMEGLEDSGGVDQTLSGNSEAQYKLKVGHACDVWTTISQMPENSLLQATGIADSTVVNMELAEVQELNGILQSGFYR